MTPADGGGGAEAESRGPRVPPTLALLLAILVASVVLAQVLPPGQYERAEREIATSTGMQKRTVVVPGTYTRVEGGEEKAWGARLGEMTGQFLMAPIRGFQAKSEVIAFILLIGGSFGMILRTGAVDVLLRATVTRLGETGRGWVVIPVVMGLFSFGGAIIGLSEEVIPFVMICVPLALRLGYDRITGLNLCYVASAIGFAGAFFNPFTVGVAQGIAEIPVFSGKGFRIVVWGIMTAVGIAYALWWAARVKARPELSPTYAMDQAELAGYVEASGGETRVRGRHLGVVAVLLGTVALASWGVTARGWYIEELSGLFLAAGLLSAVAGRLGLAGSADSFTKGVHDVAGASIIVAVSAGLVSVLQEGQVLDTILHGIASQLEGTHSAVGACLMLVFQTVLNFFVVSGSGQAAMTMPIMAPLADLMGITRQTAVLAFQFGDGLTNMIIPTSAVLMTVLGIARVPWGLWVKWILPLQLILNGIAFVALVIAVLSGYR